MASFFLPFLWRTVLSSLHSAFISWGSVAFSVRFISPVYSARSLQLDLASPVHLGPSGAVCFGGRGCGPSVGHVHTPLLSSLKVQWTFSFLSGLWEEASLEPAFPLRCWPQMTFGTRGCLLAAGSRLPGAVGLAGSLSAAGGGLYLLFLLTGILQARLLIFKLITCFYCNSSIVNVL